MKNGTAAPATIRNHGEISTPTATPPAIVRRTNPAATAAISRTASCFSHVLRTVRARYATKTKRGLGTGEERQRDRDDRQQDPACDRGAHGHHAGCDRPVAFVGCMRSDSASRRRSSSTCRSRPGRSRRRRSRCPSPPRARSAPRHRAATTSTFFAHCFGRAGLSSPTASESTGSAGASGADSGADSAAGMRERIASTGSQVYGARQAQISRARAGCSRPALPAASHGTRQQARATSEIHGHRGDSGAGDEADLGAEEQVVARGGDEHARRCRPARRSRPPHIRAAR